MIPTASKLDGSEGSETYQHVGALKAHRWSVSEWLRNEIAWDTLVSQSPADPLFLSWGWLTRWWNCYGEHLGLRPEIWTFSRGQQLVGLAPFYRYRVVRAGAVPTQSLQMIGLVWRDANPLISEYLDVIARPQDLEAVRSECARVLLAESEWAEAVIGFTSAAKEWSVAFAQHCSTFRLYARELDRSVSYHADLSQGFPAYLKELGQNSRRSIWNLRRRLTEEHGETRLEFLAPEEIEAGFRDLNRLHELRWQRPAFPGERLAFHQSYAEALAARGELAFTRLWVSGKVVSVLYDIRKGTRQYNMKMGFDPSLTNRLSLGLVHFGYAMEAAAERGAQLYDFLAGPGQTFDFKRNLGQIHRDLSCLQVLRGAVLPRVYRWRDQLRSLRQQRPEDPAEPSNVGRSSEGLSEQSH